jgi:hypothetical protein
MANNPIPPAPGRMGYIGAVVIFGQPVRALSSGLVAKQAIEHPDVVDGTIDRTLYQLGAVEVDGDVAFPVIASGTQGTAFLDFIWSNTMDRSTETGELQKPSPNGGPVVLVYSTGMARTFNGCKINSLEMRCTAGERIEGTINFMGTTVTDSGTAPAIADTTPARVLTWDNVEISPSGGLFDTCIVREFSFTIANNLSRNYTFCPSTGLFPSNISTGKRHINGTLGFQGFAPTDPARAENNSQRFTSTDSLGFRFGGFSKTFKQVVYEFQAIDINVGLVTSTVNWYAHAGTGGTPAAA